MTNRVLALLLSLAASAALFACAASKTPKHDADDPTLAPRPFTAEQIRENHPAGTLLVFRVEQAGQPTVMRRVRFVSTDDTGAVMEQSLTSESGEPVGEPQTSKVTWEELRNHASFPVDKTTITRTKCKIDTWTYDCLVYSVASGVTTTERYGFVPSRPGPPIFMEQVRDGNRVMRMELVETTQPNGA